MLESFNKNDELKFKELSPEEKASRGILGRLYGPIASIVQPTRNGRKYTESLWEKVFKNPLTQEMYNQGGVPGELDHPADREETCSEKIAIMMPEPPTKDTDGRLIGYFDIIDTPCGRIAYALAKYGFNLGISSRGTGETFTDYDGQETVDEDTYSFNAFDLVLLPACVDARLQLAESLDVRTAKFNKAIEAELKKADPQSKKIMTEALENLELYKDTSSENKVEEIEDIKDDVADNVGTDLVDELQEALKNNKALQQKVVTLQEKLSVSYTKETKLEESVTNLRVAVKRLAESVKKAESLEKQVDNLQAQLEEEKSASAQKDAIIESYQHKLSSVSKNRKGLQESVSKKDTQLQSLSNDVRRLQENLVKVTSEKDHLIESLENELTALKTDSQVKSSQYSSKLAKVSKLVERYKKLASTATERYIESKAMNFGIDARDIKRRLNENCTFDDIDEVCEQLRNYKRNMNKLPFAMDTNHVKAVALHEDTSTQRFTNPDDVVDKSLFSLINN